MSLEEWWLQGYCDISTAQWMVVANPFPAGTLWHLVWCVQKLPAGLTGRLFAGVAWKSTQVRKLVPKRSLALWVTRCSASDLHRPSFGADVLSLLDLLPLKLILLCVFPPFQFPFILYSSSMAVSSVSQQPFSEFLWCLCSSVLITCNISFLLHQVSFVLCSHFPMTPTVVKVGFVKLSLKSFLGLMPAMCYI